jgi:two-component system sensor histidine kinase KdpD
VTEGAIVASDVSSAAEHPRAIVAAIGRGSTSLAVVRRAADLARAFRCPWEAVHVVTPDAFDKNSDLDAAEALTQAAELGAAVARIPAASVADGLCAHVEDSHVTDIVIGAHRRSGWRAIVPGRLPMELIDRGVAAEVHLVPSAAQPLPKRGKRALQSAGAGSAYWKTAGLTVATAAVAMALSPWLSTGALSLLFLFPVIGTAALFGTRPGLLSAALAVLLTNFLFVEPHFAFKLSRPQSWVLAVVLGLAAGHTGFVTSELRRRVGLSDRNARENAGLASFALQLTRVSDWVGTARVVCSEVSSLMGGLQTVVVREIEGELKCIAAFPGEAMFSPVDTTALEWAWQHGEEAGSGTRVLADANWQFQPLRTSLGTLAVLGLASEDGRDPVRADQKVLLSTLIAQAALAHERLRLEDEMRAAGPAANPRSVA